MMHEATLVTVRPANLNEARYAAQFGGIFAVDVVTVHITSPSLEQMETAIIHTARELRATGAGGVIELAGHVPRGMTSSFVHKMNLTQGDERPFHPGVWPGFVRYVPE